MKTTCCENCIATEVQAWLPNWMNCQLFGGCTCHHQSTPEWEREFDTEFPESAYKLGREHQRRIKTFIRTLISKREGEIVALLEGMKRKQLTMKESATSDIPYENDIIFAVNCTLTGAIRAITKEST